jgi:hypothetical protein
LSGDSRSAELGQLALMDAMVFFLVSVVISSAILYYSSLGTTVELRDHGQGQADPHELLETLLRSHIGTEILVTLDVPRHIAGDTDIGQCLLLEAEAVLDGMSVQAFGALNEAIGEALIGICSPMYSPHLAVLSSGIVGAAALISILGPPQHTSQIYASVAHLTHDEEKDLLVRLLLCPSALPEVA